MDKGAILSIVCDVVTEVSTYAAELLVDKNDWEMREVGLVDLGLNSIDYAEIATIVMDKLSIEHSLDIFTYASKLGEVVDIFCELRQSSSKIS